MILKMDLKCVKEHQVPSQMQRVVCVCVCVCVCWQSTQWRTTFMDCRAHWTARTWSILWPSNTVSNSIRTTTTIRCVPRLCSSVSGSTCAALKLNIVQRNCWVIIAVKVTKSIGARVRSVRVKRNIAVWWLTVRAWHLLWVVNNICCGQRLVVYWDLAWN